LLAAFVLIEARATEPIIPLRLFASRQRSGAYLGRFLMVCGNFSLFFFIPQYLQNVLGFSSLEAGLAFLPFTGAQFGMMYLMHGLLHRFGNWKVLTAGLLFAIMGTLWMSRIVSVQAPFFPQMFILMTIMGIGAGMVFQPLTALGLSGVDPQDTGAASGLINVAHQSGSSLGLAVLITVFGTTVHTDHPSKMQLAHAVSDSILGSVVFITLALVTTFLCFVPARQQNEIFQN
jgi:predicted MFS family arabinose efflux permease